MRAGVRDAAYPQMGFVVRLVALQAIPDAFEEAAVGVEGVQHRLMVQFARGVLWGVVVAIRVIFPIFATWNGVVVHTPHEVGLAIHVQLAPRDSDVGRILSGLALEIHLQKGQWGRVGDFQTSMITPYVGENGAYGKYVSTRMHMVHTVYTRLRCGGVSAVCVMRENSSYGVHTVRIRCVCSVYAVHMRCVYSMYTVCMQCMHICGQL